MQEQKATTEYLTQLQENNACNDNFNLEIKQEEDIFTNDVFTPPSNIAINYHQNENKMNAQAESSYRKLVFDTKDL
jgi:hypothetical protein